MEVCVDSLESAFAAFEGGASRIELCSSLNEGGLTPTVGLYKAIRKVIPKSDQFKIFCMIRPRAGDFLYNESEIACMKEDIRVFLELECDGLVFGCLTPEGYPDEKVLREFLSLVPNGFATTFHRAFDMCADWKASLEIIKQLGFTRLLTSGLQKSAFEGRHIIRECVTLNKRDTGDLIILPGAGINFKNLDKILRETKCSEFHASCRASRQSKMLYRNENISMGSPGLNEYEIMQTDKNLVKQLVQIFNEIQHN